MTSKYVCASLIGLVMLTANCGKLEELEDARQFADLAIDANRVRTRVLGDPVLGREGLRGTVWDDVPTSGSATFLGTVVVAAVSADNPDAGFALVGRSDVTVDFGPGEDNITGTMDQFQSSKIGEGILDASGQLQLENGVVGNLAPNQFAVDYSGDVTVEGKTYAMSGDMLGRFLGTRTEPEAGQSTIRALSAVDINGNVESGGERLVGRLNLIAEN
ncbi:hypothetical protein K3729_13145 [Rhodobacteraceae bacterium S2214]|nr:hypothetical protein K3729_13145 [Rhodobacteraceae bacterium S2214]